MAQKIESIRNDPTAWFALMCRELTESRERIKSSWYDRLSEEEQAQAREADRLVAHDFADAALAYVAHQSASVAQGPLAGGVQLPAMVQAGLDVIARTNPSDFIGAVERLLKMARPGDTSKMRAQNVYHIHAPRLSSLALAGEPFSLTDAAVDAIRRDAEADARAEYEPVVEALDAARKQLVSLGVEPKPPLGFTPEGLGGFTRSFAERRIAELEAKLTAG